MKRQEQYMDDVYQYHKELEERKNEKMKDPKYFKYLRYKNIFVKCIKLLLILWIIRICFFIFECLLKMI